MPTTDQKAVQPAGTAEPDSAIRYLWAHVLLWATAGATLAADLWTKHWAFTELGWDEAREGFFGLVSYQRSLNDGALFGMGQGLVSIFIIASVLAVAFILYFFGCSHRRQRLLHVALAFILAGALGNMFDRTFMSADRLVLTSSYGKGERVLGRFVGDQNGDVIHLGSWPEGSHPQQFDRKCLAEPPRSIGVVRDFIKIELQIAGRDVWPWVFNIADTLLVVGVGMLLITFAFDRRSSAKT
ncbi:MAG: signal peptidase II [Phycisphaerae bacterium]|nr:signal peptidase II [Phycisphaerae bacterium]